MKRQLRVVKGIAFRLTPFRSTTLQIVVFLRAFRRTAGVNPRVEDRHAPDTDHLEPVGTNLRSVPAHSSPWVAALLR